MLAQVIATVLVAQGAGYGDCFTPRAVAGMLAAKVPDLILVDTAEDAPSIARYVEAFNQVPPPAENLTAEAVGFVMTFTVSGQTRARFFLFDAENRCMVATTTISTDRALELRGPVDVKR